MKNALVKDRIVSLVPQATDALQMVDNEPRVSTREMAKVFGQAHKSVLRRVDGIIAYGDTFNRHNFAPITFVDPKGRTYKEYQLTEKGFMLVVMGMTGPRAHAVRIAFILAFEEMQKRLAKVQPQFDVADKINQVLAGITELRTQMKQPLGSPALQVPPTPTLPDTIANLFKRANKVANFMNTNSLVWVDRFHVKYKRGEPLSTKEHDILSKIVVRAEGSKRA